MERTGMMMIDPHGHLVDEASLADQLREEINREIIAEARQIELMQKGWYRVPPWNETQRLESWDDEAISTWLSANCLGRYEIFCGKVAFSSREDAVAFSMVWG
jgi:hypothetical protein